MGAKQESMRVIELVVENYMGVQAVDIRPDANVVRIEGKNGAGKSSVINAIWSGIGGMTESGKHPLRNGAKKGRTFVDLGNIRVERKFTEAGTYLEVSDKDGKRVPKPQEFLGQFFSKTTMDPMNFLSMKPADRRDLLLELTGARDEIVALDAQRSALYEERTLVNREVKSLQGKLSGVQVPVGDVEEVPIVGLLEALEASLKSDADVVADKDIISRSESSLKFTNGQIENCKNRIAELERQIQTWKKNIKDFEADIATFKADAEMARSRVESAPPSQTDAIRGQIADAEKSNEVVRRNRELVDTADRLKDKKSEADALTDEITVIDDRKKQILQESALSVGSVDFDNDTLLVDGTPFDDLSTSEQLRISLEIALSQNPSIRVVRISDGNVFDEDNMNDIEVFAEEHDCQLWIERVADKPDGLGFFIKEGSVIE
jgi:DNA repair exonuclease SbcCD ATPase subunit